MEHNRHARKPQVKERDGEQRVGTSQVVGDRLDDEGNQLVLFVE
jgi:hypothetical protein